MRIEPGHGVKGRFTPPGDKSITHRALLLAALAKGESVVDNALDSDDTQATAEILKALGVDVTAAKGTWTIRSPGMHGFKAPTKALYAGESGTTARIFLGLLAGQSFASRLEGAPALCRRPMQRVLQPLEMMGAKFNAPSGCLPVDVKANNHLHGIEFENTLASAQVKSAVLLAGLYAEGETIVTEARPSRDHTERMLAARGAAVVSRRHNQHCVRVTGATKLPATNCKIPGDFSSAAFLITAACLLKNSSLEVEAVGLNPTRLGLWDALQAMGAQVEILAERLDQGEPVGRLRISSSALTALPVAGEQVVRMIDEIPIWAVAAACAQGESVLKDAQELRVKESDRLHAMTENLRRLGVKVKDRADGLSISGGVLHHPRKSGYGPGYLESFGDHRLAMAMAVAALAVEDRETVEIRGSECVSKSYPEFMKDFCTLTGHQHHG